MISNIDAFWDIAVEAHRQMHQLIDAGRLPKSDGSLGYVVKLDPDRRAFKQALITITFAGIYYEAFTYFLGKEVGDSLAKKVDCSSYPKKLISLGITDQALIDKAESFKNDRNDLIHEKALRPSEIDDQNIRFSAPAADSAMEFVSQVRSSFGLAKN